MIEVNNLVKRYGNHTAVDHLSFKIEKGKIYGFLGPNGAGKSTTMNMITGYIASTEGTVKIDGHDILEEPEAAKKCIGYLPEQPPVYFDMTVLEYMKFVADLKKIPKDKKANMIEEVMDMVKISDMRNRLIKNLSKGYRQRVGLAEAIMGYPEVIILDEPTVGLDPKQIIEIRTLIKELKKKHTVILSSHILSEVSAVCDYVLIISHGKLVASDTPENLGKLAEGYNTLEMLIKGEKTQIRQALEGIEGVNSVTMEKDEKQNLWSVKVSTEEQNDIREKVFYKMSEINSPIYEMKSRKVSLEEIFLELTASDKPISADEVPNTPEDKDTDFTWREYINIHNNELVGELNNFVNKVLLFSRKNYANRVPNGKMDEKLKNEILNLYFDIGDKIEEGHFRDSLNDIMNLCKKGNKYFDNSKVWDLLSSDSAKCKDVTYNCIQIIVNLSNLLYPFMPGTCEKIKVSIGLNESIWSFTEKKEGLIKECEVLFNKIDKKRVSEEVARLKEKKN